MKNIKGFFIDAIVFLKDGEEVIRLELKNPILAEEKGNGKARTEMEKMKKMKKRKNRPRLISP